MSPFKRFAIALVGVSLSCLLSGACDSKPPDYLVQNDVLRLVPESSTVSSDGGPLYVLLELTRTDANAKSIVVAESKGAILSPLPGQGICSGSELLVGTGTGNIATGAGGEAGSPGSGGSSATAGSGGAGGSVDTTGTIVLPQSELLADTVRTNVHETGFVLDVPAAETDVLVVATAFDHIGADDACDGRGSAVAVASVRITRTKPGTGTGGTGAVDSGAQGATGGGGSLDGMAGASSGMGGTGVGTSGTGGDVTGGTGGTASGGAGAAAGEGSAVTGGSAGAQGGT